MGERLSFKFSDRNLNRRLVKLLEATAVEHSVGRDGTIYYSSKDEEYVENELIASVRDKVFRSWQVLSFPPDWEARYRRYMTQHDIPFQAEFSNGELCFLIPRRYRPSSWRIGSGRQKELAGSR